MNYRTPNPSQANAIEEQFDDFTKVIENNHIDKMTRGICITNTESGNISFTGF